MENEGSWYSIYYWQHHNNFFMQIFSQAWKNHEIHDINIAKMLVFYFLLQSPRTNMGRNITIILWVIKAYSGLFLPY